MKITNTIICSDDAMMILKAARKMIKLSTFIPLYKGVSYIRDYTFFTPILTMGTANIYMHISLEAYPSRVNSCAEAGRNSTGTKGKMIIKYRKRQTE